MSAGQQTEHATRTSPPRTRSSVRAATVCGLIAALAFLSGSAGCRRSPGIRSSVTSNDGDEEAVGRVEFRAEQEGEADESLAGRDPRAESVDDVMNAWEQIKEDRIEVAGLKLGRGSKLGKGLTAPAQGDWLGPKDIGGRTRALAIDPRDPSHIWAGSVAGGVWRFQKGEGWAVIQETAGFPVSSLAVDAKTGSIYVGTGEYIGDRFGTVNAKRVAGLRGSGIWVGRGGWTGEKWERITDRKMDAFDFVNRLAIGEHRGKSVLLAATWKGLFRYVDDGSDRWNRVRDGETAFSDVEFHPGDASRAIAADFTSDGKALYSDDAGLTWKEAAHQGWHWQGKVDLTFAEANPEIAYASVGAARDADKDDRTKYRGKIFCSTDGGRTYQARATKLDGDDSADYLSGNGSYCNAIWAGGADANQLLIGGPGLTRSSDGGESLKFVKPAQIPDGVPFSDQHAIVTRPGRTGSTALSVYVVNDNGVFLADDVFRDDARGPDWRPINDGYGTLQLNGACVHEGSGIILGGAEDNDVFYASPRDRARGRWRRVVEVGDGGLCVADPSSSTPLRFYITGQFLSITRLELTPRGDEFDEKREPIDGRYWDKDNVLRWKDTGFRIDDIAPVEVTGIHVPGPNASDNPKARTLPVNFIAPLVMDPDRPRRLLAGASRLWETQNADDPTDSEDPSRTGPNWRELKSVVRDSDNRIMPISTIAVAKGHPEVVWVGHIDGQLFRTDDCSAGQPTWHAESITEVKNRWCTRIVIDPADPAHVFAMFGGYNEDNLWEKRGNAPWTCIKIQLGLDSPRPLKAPVRCLAIHPDHPEFYYLATDVGLLGSGDVGKSWVPTQGGPILCPVDELFWMGRILGVATHARGFYSIDLRQPGNSPRG
jgi:hypothetical protein